jgi:hypothetical protein
MKKLFRFKYEPCKGDCYYAEELFQESLRKLDSKQRKELIDLVVKAHDNLCDNPDYSFGLDFCLKTQTFIGHFQQPDRIDVFASKTFHECIIDLCQDVANANIPTNLGNCEYGVNGNENLAEIISRSC